MWPTYIPPLTVKRFPKPPSAILKVFHKPPTCTIGILFSPVPPVRNEQWRNSIYDSEMKPGRNFDATFVTNFRNSKCNQ
jgi:hypothetical protein